MKKILICGNLGYVGTVLNEHIIEEFNILGLDNGYFCNTLDEKNKIKKNFLQIYKDVRKIDKEDLSGIYCIVYLSAVSNDPMGKLFKDATYQINYESAIKVAKLAKENHVEKFIFASSCSVYGKNSNSLKNENDEVDPLTDYAISKIRAENDLKLLVDNKFEVTSLRFATACGYSPKMRLDLVLNDFVASAITNGYISVLSDGSPIRPFVHIKDMCKAIEWAIKRNDKNKYICVNVGRNDNNYTIKEIAYKVANLIPSTEVKINSNASKDDRSYKVDFNLYKKIASNYALEYNIEKIVKDILLGLKLLNFKNKNFRNSNYIRFNQLNNLIKLNKVDNLLIWK